MELKVSQLSKSYKDCQAIHNISFSIQSGEIVGLLGHNGAGKSTLIKCMMNAIKSYSGYITINGQDIKKNQDLLCRECSFLLEPSFCDYLSAKTNLELLSDIVPNKSNYSIDEILSIVSLKKSTNKKVGEFSFGMKQRLGLAQIFLSTPHFVILDEPTVGLDPVGIDIIKDIILELSKAKVSVLFSSHQITDVFDICTRAIVINDGKKVFDDKISRLYQKKYVIFVNKSISHANYFYHISPNVQIEQNALYITESSDLTKIINALIEEGYEIEDLNIDSNYDTLKTFLSMGGIKNAKDD